MKRPDVPAMDPLDAYRLTLDDERRLRRLRGDRVDEADLKKIREERAAAYRKLSPERRELATDHDWRASPENYDAREALYDMRHAPLSERPPKYWWDIEMLPRAHYHVDIEWGGVERQLERWTKDYRLDLSPDFQREHVWTVKQQIAYVEYQLKGGEVGRNIVFNHPDWTGIAEHGRLEIVDGKQRIEAVRAFMGGAVPAFGRRCQDWSGSLRMIQGAFKFCVVEMRTKADLLRLYLQINAGGTPHTEAELNKVRRMLELEKKNEKP